MSFACILESMRGHSALRLKSRICVARGVDEPCVLSPCSPCQSPNLSSQNKPRAVSLEILECLAESSPTDFKEVSESTFSESLPLQNLKSKVDSESASAVEQRSTAIKSSFSSKRCAEQALKASSGWGIVKGEGATSQFKPLPLNKKEKKESDEVNQTLEAKAKDSEKLDSESKSLTNRDISNFCPQYDRVSESKNKAESAMVGYSEKRALESKKLESATDSQKIHCRAFPKPKTRNASRLDSKSLTKSAIAKDSKKPQVPKSHTPKHASFPLTPRLAFHALYYGKCAHIHHKALAC